MAKIEKFDNQLAENDCPRDLQAQRQAAEPQLEGQETDNLTSNRLYSISNSWSVYLPNVLNKELLNHSNLTETRSM